MVKTQKRGRIKKFQDCIYFASLLTEQLLCKLLCRTSHFPLEKYLVFQFDLCLSLKLALEKILHSEKRMLLRTNTNKNLSKPGFLHFF